MSEQVIPNTDRMDVAILAAAVALTEKILSSARPQTQRLTKSEILETFTEAYDTVKTAATKKSSIN